MDRWGSCLNSSKRKIAYQKAGGFSDQELTAPLSTDNIFRMASMTKPITSLAVMQLVEQAKINVQDPVSKHIPEFSVSKVVQDFNEEDSSYTLVEANRLITIHDLLTHTSGLSYSGGAIG